MLLERVCGVLQPFTDAATGSLGTRWHCIPAFFVFFLVVYVATIPFWRYVAKLTWKKTFLLASCGMSSFHGAACISYGYHELFHWPQLHLDLPNSPSQVLLAQFSLAYLLADYVLYILPVTPGDMIFTVHHAISAVYLVSSMKVEHGLISGILMFYMGEITSPLLNVFTVSRELRHRSTIAARVFKYTGPAFTAAFLLVRSVIAPPLVAWFVWTLWFRATLIPLSYRVPMGLCVSLGILGSQAWSFKLVQGILHKRRKAKEA